MAGDTFQKLGDSMSRAITKLSVKTSSSLEKSKIKMHIESLTADMQKMLMDVGEEVYALWLKGESSNQSLVDKLETVKQRKAEIEQLSTELASIDDRDNEILGTKVETEQKPEVVISIKPCSPTVAQNIHRLQNSAVSADINCNNTRKGYPNGSLFSFLLKISLTNRVPIR